jgi:FdhD protein
MGKMVRPSPQLRRTVTSVRVTAIRDGSQAIRPDRLATEEPMEIRVGAPRQEAVSVSVTMRTPGNDFELATGFLYTEGLVRTRDEIVEVSYCELPLDEQLYNVVTVRLTHPFDPSMVQRNFYATSSCGICGKASLDQVRVSCAPVGPGFTVDRSIILGLPDTLRRGQRIFAETGGLHAAGLFDRRGRLLLVREDIGRHNALDKLVGASVLSGEVPLADRILLVSGRAGFEIIQKAAVAGIPVVCAVSAPSSLAVEAGGELGLTIVGFLRPGGFNLYSHPERIDEGGL